MLNVMMLNAIMLNAIMLNPIMPNAIMLNAIMLSVMAPRKGKEIKILKKNMEEKLQRCQTFLTIKLQKHLVTVKNDEY